MWVWDRAASRAGFPWARQGLVRYDQTDCCSKQNPRIASNGDSLENLERGASTAAAQRRGALSSCLHGVRCVPCVTCVGATGSHRSSLPCFKATRMSIRSEAAGDPCTGHQDCISSLEARIPLLGLGHPSKPARVHSSPSAMSLPPIFSLSNELVIEIISNLCPNDIHACRLTCRQLNELIVNSQLIQYIIRTALSGVFDPLDPGHSLPERLVALHRWEIAWAEMDLRVPDVHIDAPVPIKIGPPVEFSFGRYFVVIREGYGRSAGYSFLDMHAGFSAHADAARWTNIEVDTPNVLVFAFASELDLAVAISAPDTPDRRKTTLKICPMWFSTGKPHPLASRPTLEVGVAGASAYNLSDTEVIGDYILYWVGAPMLTRNHDGTLCNIYLVAWKEGWVTELRCTHPGVYGSVLSVLSEDMIMLIRLREPALELCRLNDISEPNASLETLCILSLPELTMSASLRWATCFGEHPGHALFMKGGKPPDGTRSQTSGPSRQLESKGKGTRRHLRSVPANGIISVVMHVHGLSGYFRTIDLSVRCRTLLSFAEMQARLRMGTGPGVVLTVPWEGWGPANTRIVEHDSLTWGSLVGERRATVGQLRPTCITMRDYNPFRVRRALERTGGTGKELTLECGSVIKVVNDTSVYRGGEWFCDDIETSLAYVETVTPYAGCEGIFMDEVNLLAEVRTETGERKFFLHCL
ncbi:hypothetical protein F5148DRAFT_445625 [Russula earlei]|uniref:Uncharacterized protein n=1 Tax=Russula earlei TaxID=71964 RepID=A0ACC0TYU5_9AGAM|nr:hypothetical protein F5148DRAFT_445625 [Russula earlei]